jgi:signal transduction histidine kinase
MLSLQQEYRELLDSLPQIVWSSPAMDWPDYFNRRWFEYTGLPLRSSVIHSPPTDHQPAAAPERQTPSSQYPVSSTQNDFPPSWASLVHPEDLQTFVAEWNAALQAGARFGLMLRLRRASDGLFRWHLARGNPIRDAQSNLTGWAGTLADVQDRVEVEQKLKALATDLARSNDELEHFASAVAHDLNQPPRQVGSVIQLLLSRPERLDAETVSLLKLAYGGAKQMQLLLNGLLEYARLGTEIKPVDSVDSRTVYENAVAKLRSQIEESGAELIATPMPRVRGDESALARLFKELIKNAIKFRSTARLKVYIQAERLGKDWRFELRDNGLGIPQNCFRRLFILFQHFHPEVEQTGIGLGLAVSKKIVELHQGRIWAEPAAGGGMSFFFTLPAVDSA